MSFASTARRSKSTANTRPGSYSDLAAEYYDATRHPTCANLREASAIFLADELANSNTSWKLVAEIGAGKSLLTELVPAATLAPCRLALIDASYEMLLHSADWLRAGSSGIVADARQLPVHDSIFDLVVVALGDPFNDQELWGEIARVLRPDGLCLFTMPAYAWTQAFRANIDSRIDLAEFLTADGETLSLPSFSPPPYQQREMIQTAGPVVLRQRTIALREIVSTPWSPKLLPSRGADAAVVDAFVIAGPGRQPYLT